MDEPRLASLPRIDGAATPCAGQCWKLWIYTNYDCR